MLLPDTLTVKTREALGRTLQINDLGNSLMTGWSWQYLRKYFIVKPVNFIERDLIGLLPSILWLL
jgi:hypothetical protein